MRARDINKVELVKQKAIELLVEVGFEGFTMNKLAKACKISVATLYIYYQDKDDLILKVGIEEVERMSAIMLENFDPESSFEEGLKQQWKNRAKCLFENPWSAQMIEQLRTSTYQLKVLEVFGKNFKEPLGKFMHNSIERGEIDQMPFETYWSIAFAPLYNLIRFHNEGQSLGGKPFVLTDEILWKTFELVIKALKK
ncbi:TetR/AcrR family transcriptional regulator [Pedobacter heparinus]|uniref:Regulatory protein TetR n=1 Tax=Pedobacter heparinus (strain ATCC 13125 / DSM 2366 / CIP 104194 / JCM 7457 / NBRC 12017 / NCIMB 9290 / NRRL B-14731 / HIM 762-3) TaxID=485917 RepID=C6XST5_PEDHD|nr:TetR/AcrR family transcriptional regulator [Pedobacter heparinus]ACU05648.1 regulatory protein TetR [Pedobacter heparinus DSM 2366]